MSSHFVFGLLRGSRYRAQQNGKKTCFLQASRLAASCTWADVRVMMPCDRCDVGPGMACPANAQGARVSGHC